MFEAKSLSVTLVWIAAVAPLLPASGVSTSVSQGGTPTNPTTTVTITVTAGQGESITDFHLFPTKPKSKINGNATFGQPSGWGAPTGSGSNEKGKHWKVDGGGAGIGGGASGQFTITVPGASTDLGWTQFDWVTSDNGSSTTPQTGGNGWVDGGTSGLTELIPFVSIALIGPETVAAGETARFEVEAGIAPGDAVTYTVSAALSLDPADPGRVNSADPLPDSWGIEISTNSRTGTSAAGQGVRQATYFGSRRNHVLVDVPGDPALIGRTIYLQVDFGNGDSTAPHALRIVDE